MVRKSGKYLFFYPLSQACYNVDKFIKTVDWRICRNFRETIENLLTLTSCHIKNKFFCGLRKAVYVKCIIKSGC